MTRPVTDRLAEARRMGAWPFLSWCFVTRAVVPELELLVGKARGIHFSTWARLHPDDVARARRAARELGWCPEYAARVAVGALALVCLTRAVTLDTLTAADLDAVAVTIADSPLIPAATRQHLRAEHHGLRVLCYQLGVLDTPPEHGNVRRISLAERVADITQPRIREVVLRYLRTIASTLRPKSVEGRAASLRGFAGWLATTHPDITTLAQLGRSHLEEFLIFHAGRVSHGRTRRGLPISVRHHHRTVNDLRVFFDDLAAWGWADRPTGPLVHRSDVPRLPTAAAPRAAAGHRHRAEAGV
jgi:hypothetical protein